MADKEIEVIYLQPLCCAGTAEEGRLWCEDDISSDWCSCGNPSVRYVLDKTQPPKKQTGVK